MVTRQYSGPDIDATYEYITERPELAEDSSETVYATEPETVGEEETVNVPVPRPGPDEDAEGQTSLSDWGGGSSAE